MPLMTTAEKKKATDIERAFQDGIQEMFQLSRRIASITDFDVELDMVNPAVTIAALQVKLVAAVRAVADAIEAK